MRGSKSPGHSGHCVIYSDGGSRGNPGPAAAGGLVLRDDGSVVAEVSEVLGVTTNNVAEYRALLLLLQRALDAGFQRADVYMDSELVVRQINGQYRVKDEKIMPLHAAARRMMARFAEVRVGHVPRVKNKRADKLVNAALDAQAAKAAE